MVNKADVDFGKTAKDYAKHRAGFPTSFFDKLKTSGWLQGTHRCLDLGTGTGTIARGLAKEGFSVTGIDPAPALLAEANELDSAAGVQVAYAQGSAESTCLADHSFDVVTAGQCWHWFNQDLAVKEIQRILRPSGLLIVAYFDWLDVPGNPVDEMHRLRLKYNPSWKSSWPLGFYPQKPGELRFPGFQSTHSFFYQEDVPYTHQGWRGRMRAYAGIGGSLPANTVEEFDREFADVLKEKFPVEPMQIPHKIWAEAWKPA